MPWPTLFRGRLQRNAPPVDVELGLAEEHRDKHIDGYPAAAAFIAADPDRSLSIYRCFQRLSSRNLLYLEAELLELEKQQDILDVEDSRGDQSTYQCLRSWRRLVESENPRQRQRLELIKKIRSTLKEYYKVLDLQGRILKMESPQSRSLETLRLWQNGDSEGSNGRRAPILSGLSAGRLENENDLVTLTPNSPEFNTDWLVKLVSLPYLRLLCLESHINNSIAHFSMRKINRAAAILNMLIAAVLLLGAIILLYFITDSHIRIGIICIFTVAFALSIYLLTNARRTEVFASTAAYAAVLVVFVSGNLGA
ncbi:hypothetical protein B0J14DRAFT_205829 [Halenospora varia]|nr:hypothetical protein B0J14DRAFT_205829 [Halenospora varia]